MTSWPLITMPRAKGTLKLVSGYVEALFSPPCPVGGQGKLGLVLSCLRLDSASSSVLWAPDPAGEGTGCSDTIWVGWGSVIPQASRIWQLGICTASPLELHV